MSRIGRMPVAIPAGVTVTIAENNLVTVKGPKGTLERELPVEMNIKEEDGHIVVTRPNDLKKMKSLHGLTRTLINNMIHGVTAVSYTHLIRSGFDRLGVGGLENKRRIADWNWGRSVSVSYTHLNGSVMFALIKHAHAVRITILSRSASTAALRLAPSF